MQINSQQREGNRYTRKGGGAAWEQSSCVFGCCAIGSPLGQPTMLVTTHLLTINWKPRKRLLVPLLLSLHHGSLATCRMWRMRNAFPSFYSRNCVCVTRGYDDACIVECNSTGDFPESRDQRVERGKGANAEIAASSLVYLAADCRKILDRQQAEQGAEEEAKAGAECRC